MAPEGAKLADILGASIISGLVGGATYAGGAAINSGADWSQFTGAVVQGMAMGGLSSGAGAFSGIFTQGVFQNGFAKAILDTSTTTGAGIGVSLLSGQDVDWGAVAVQSSLSLMRGFYRALEQEQASSADRRKAAGGAASPKKCGTLCPPVGFESAGDKSMLAGAEYSIGRALHDEDYRLAST